MLVARGWQTFAEPHKDGKIERLLQVITVKDSQVITVCLDNCRVQHPYTHICIYVHIHAKANLYYTDQHTKRRELFIFSPNLKIKNHKGST